MVKIFKWEYKPSGNCPVQAEGWFLNYYFYFRARGTKATIEFYKNRDSFDTDEPVNYIELKETEAYQAGWLSEEVCKWLVYKGCFLFLFGGKY